jgi:ActR/RegA family two-component response regulator
MTQTSSLLLVDADLHGLETLTYGFEREGRKVNRTSDLTRAVQLSRTSAPTLAVVMLREPAQPALDVIASLRGVHRQLPILALGPAQLQSAARDAGANDYLATPTFIRDVVTVAKLVALAVETEASADQTDAEAALSEFHGLYYLLRAMAATARSCVLRLARGPQRAEIRFANGKVVSATARALQHLPALHHVLLWEEAGVSIRMGPVTASSQFPLSAQEVLDECERFLRDFAHAAKELGPSGTIYVPAAGSPQVAGIQPSQMAPLVKLFDGRRGLAEVVQESPFRIFDTVRMIKRLRDAGALLERVPVRRPSERHQTLLAGGGGATNGTQRRPTGPQSMLAQWAMVPDQRGVVGDRRSPSRPLMPFGPGVVDQPGNGADRRRSPSRPVAPLAARGPVAGLPVGGRRQTAPMAPLESQVTPGPQLLTPGPTPEPTPIAPIPLVHKKGSGTATASGELPEVRHALTPNSMAALELGPTVQVKLNSDGTPISLPTAPAVAATPLPVAASDAFPAPAQPQVPAQAQAQIVDEPPPVRVHDAMPSPVAVLESPPPVAALDGAPSAIVLDTPPPQREVEPQLPQVVDAPPPARPRTGSGPRPSLSSRRTPVPRLTPSAAFDAVEADFFAREADLYKRETVETFDDLDKVGGDASGKSRSRRK